MPSKVSRREGILTLHFSLRVWNHRCINIQKCMELGSYSCKERSGTTKSWAARSWAGQPRSLGSVPNRGRDFSFLGIVCTGSGACPVSYLVGPEALPPRWEADHSHQSGAELNNAWTCTSTPLCVSMMWCFAKHRDSFIFCRNMWARTRSNIFCTSFFSYLFH